MNATIIPSTRVSSNCVRARRSAKFCVTTSVIDGRGLFSKVVIRKGDVIFRLTGTCRCEAYEKDEYEVGPNWFGIGLNRWLIPNGNSPGNFLNHSCEANTRLRDDLAIAATHRIAVGVEILIDYSTIEHDPYWRMKCRCNTAKCRGIVRPFYQVFGSSRRRVLAMTPTMLRRVVAKKRVEVREQRISVGALVS